MKKEFIEFKNEILRRFAPKAIQIPITKFIGKRCKIGVISDTHLGSLHENIGLLLTAYSIFEREKVQAIYHAGDLCEGERMFRGQEYEIYAHGADAQVKNCVDKYPVSKIPTYFILGSHDLSFFKTSGIDIGTQIADKRPELHYCGREVADIRVKLNGHTIKIRLVHPGKGSAYAVSYYLQKHIEALTGGEKPNILIQGHTHKSIFIFYRNIFALQAGTCQHQTPFMQRQGLAAHQGFWIIEFAVNNEGSVCSFRCEFFPHYEEEK